MRGVHGVAAVALPAIGSSELGADKALAEAFVLAIDGFCADTPSVKALRARIGIMIDRFCPDG